MSDEENLKDLDSPALLLRIAQEMKMMRQMMVTIIGYIKDAESEMPEKYRRFVNAFHDVHDIKYMHEEHGVDAPQEVLREIERMSDRYRQILEEYNAEGGAFNKVRRAMASDPNNRYDHTRQLAAPKKEA